MEPCLIGILSKSNCHESWYSRKPGLMLLSSLSQTEIELLTIRSSTTLSSHDIASKSICSHHHAYFLRKFVNHTSRNCCDIFGIHKGKKPKGSREITLELAKSISTKFPKAIPGYRLCVSCHMKAKSIPADSALSSESTTESESEHSTTRSDWELTGQLNLSKEKINQALQICGQSPIEMHSKPIRQRQVIVKRKLSAVGQRSK